MNENVENTDLTPKSDEDIVQEQDRVNETINKLKEDRGETPSRLTDKMRKTCLLRLSGMDDYKAYMEVYGVMDKMVAKSAARRLFKFPQCVQFMAKENAKIGRVLRRRGVASKQDIAKKLWETAERCSQDIKPILDRKGNPVLTEDKDGNMCPAFTFDSRGTVSACGELIDLLGYAAPKEVKSTVEIVDVSKLSVDKAMQLLKDLEKKELELSANNRSN